MVRVRDLSPDDAPALTDLYAEYGWWADRDVETVRRALADTEVAVGVVDGDRLVASARVLTDYRYYANVFDVVVAGWFPSTSRSGSNPMTARWRSPRVGPRNWSG